MATDHNFKVKKGLDVLGGDVNLGDGFAYKIDGTTVVDSSRNLSNIGTISSGAITSSGGLTLNTGSDQIITLNQATTGWNYIGFSVNGTRKFYLGNDSSDGFIIGSDVANKTFTLASFGSVNIGAANLNTSGTISSGNITSSGNVTISGNLTVNGTQTTLNTATLQVEDKNIVLNYGSGDTSGSANGAGITIQDAVNSTTNATIEWSQAGSNFNVSHGWNTLGYLQHAGVLYSRNNLLVLNSAGTGWNTWATRSNGNFNLSVGTISSGAISTSGNLTITKQTPLLTIETASNSTNPELRLKSNGGFSGEGFGIHYDNSVGDAHFQTTYSNNAASLKFYTATGGSPSSSNLRFEIGGDGNFDFNGGNFSDVGTLSSGAITSSGTLQSDDITIKGGTGTTTESSLTFENYADTAHLKSKYTNPNATTETYLAFHTNKAGESNGTVSESMRLSGNNLSVNGTISSGAITSSGKLKTQYNRSDVWADAPSWTEQSWDTLVLYNGNASSAANQMSSIYMRADGGGNASSRIILRNDNSGNGRLYFMMRSGSHTGTQQPKMLITDDGLVTISDNATTYNERLFVDGNLRVEGVYKIGTNTVIDSSRNITAGTISSGAITSSGTIQATSGDVVVGTLASAATGSLYLTGSTANKQARLRCTNGNLHMDPASGNSMYLNYYAGAGIYFGNGATGSNANILANGNFTTSGAISSGAITSNGGAAWGETTQGTTKGTIHLDPENATDHYGGAITFGASDSGSGNTAMAGIYTRSDGSYGTKMYLATTDSYVVGPKTAITIDQAGAVTINRSTLNVQNGLLVGGTAVINSSRNLTNIGTYSGAGDVVAQAANVMFHARSSADGQTVGYRAGYTNHATLQAFFRYATGDAQLYIDNDYGGNNGVYSNINFRNKANGGSSLINRLTIHGSTGNVNVTGGNLQMGGTTVIDSSRNITASSITSTGTGQFTKMGLGVAPNSAYYLHINRVSGNPNIKSSDAYLLMDSNGGMAGLNWYSSDRVVLANGGGNVGIGSSGNHTQKLYVSGSVRSTSSIRADAGFDVSGTTVIDASRNLTNIGNITATSGFSLYLGTTSRFSSDNNGGFGINYGTTGGTANDSLSIYNNTTATVKLTRDGTAVFTRAQSAADFDAIQIAYTGGWSGYQDRLAGVNVTDNTNAANTVGRFGVTYGSGGGSFVVTDLYDGGYGASGDVFRVRGTGVVEITSDLKMNGTTVIDSSRNVIGTIRPSVDNAWKIRGNSGNAQLAFEYSTSTGLGDTNIQVELGNTGNVIFGGRLSQIVSGYQAEIRKASTTIGDGGSAGALNLRATGNFYLRHNGSDALTFNGSTITASDHLNLPISGDAITISSTAPQIRFNDTDHDDFWIHVNSNRFYILADRDNSGGWETPFPMELNAATNVPLFFGNQAWTAGNDGSGSGLDADTVDSLQASDFARRNAAWSSAAAWKQTFHSGSGGATFGNNHYSMGVDTANGSWSNPNYSDLIIGYHTGIRIGGGYSGVRFYNNSPTTDTNNDGNGEGNESLLMTVGGGGTGTGGAHVYIENSLYIKNGGSTNNIAWNAGNDGTGSGLDADTVDSIQGASILRNDASNTVGTYSNRTRWYSNTNLASASSTQASLECYSSGGGNDAFMAFHVGGDFACYLGLDGGTNKLSVGGWSMGTNSYEIYHAGNKPSLATLGYTGATNANYITNNNQLANGSGFLTATNDRAYITDSRGASRAPSYYDDRYVQWDFQNNTDTGAGGDGWHALQTVSKWASFHTSHRQEQLAFTGNNLKHRVASSDSAWNSWDQLWDSGNDGPGSGLDADTVDSIQGASLLRSDANDSFSGQLTMSTQKALIASDQGHGVYGLYSASKYQHVWSMGTSYNAPPNGASTGTVGNLYGLAWTYNPNYGATGNNAQGKAGLNHQLLLCMNGITYTALGNGIWTSGSISRNGNTVWDAGNDGPGTGLDADTVDGIQAASTLHKLNNTGYYRPDTWIDFRDASGSGLYWGAGTGSGWHIHPHSTAIMRFRSGSGTQSFLELNTTGTARGYVYANNSNEVGFLNNSQSWRLKCVAGGSVYMGGTQQMRINSSATTGILEATSTNLVLRASGGGTISFQKSGGTALGEFTNSGNLNVLGNVTAYGSPSDIKLKENIETISNAVEKVQKLDGVTFNYKKDGGRSTGLIAQQLQEVLPEVVYTTENLDGEEHLAVRYGNTVGLLVEAIKELKQEINELKAQLKEK